MDDQNAGSSSECECGSRPPTDADLAEICRRLNERGARYVVAGGGAIIDAGYLRLTGGINLLVDLMAAASGITFREAEPDIIYGEIRCLLALPACQNP